MQNIMSIANLWYWIALFILMALLLFIDLFLLHKKDHIPSFKESLVTVGAWVGLALLFNLTIFFLHGSGPALEFLTGYILEESLSVDNLFVFIMLFASFSVPKEFQHKILFAGIIGAIFFRILFIIIGTALITKFAWILYVFGIFLLYTGGKILLKRKDSEKTFDIKKSKTIRLCRLFFKISEDHNAKTFFLKENGKLCASYLFVVVLVIESTDIMFAIDSIPAVLSVTQDPFIVFSSNIFAVMGLRALYFLLNGLMDKFVYLNIGLGIILSFVGIKLLVHSLIAIPILFSLAFIFVVLFLCIAISFLKEKRHKS